MLVLTLGPQMLLYIGNGLAEDDVWGYIQREWDQIGPIVASALLISGIIASIGLAIGAYVPRRSYATVAILAAFIIPITVANILIETTDPEVSRYFLLLSPTIFEGFALWFFNAPVDSEALLDADFAGYIYLLAGLAWLAIGAVFLVRRFQRVTA